VARIDLHAHVLTPGFGESLRLPDGSRPPLPPQDVDRLKTFMEQYGIAAAVVSMGAGTATTSAELARTGNEELAEIVHAEPERFGAVAILPFTPERPDAALAELEYALDTLRLDGIALFSNHAGTYLGDPSFDPLFAELDRRGAYAFVHPTFPVGGWPLQHHPVWLYEFPFDTTRAIANLIYSGTLERYPNVRLQFAHLGGTALFLAHRVASLAAREPQLATGAPAGAIDYLRRQYYDTGLSNNCVALASTQEVTSLDHVVFGSDWPYLAAREGRDPSDDFESLDPSVRQQIDAENAAALVPRLAAQVAGVGSRE
jgi:predicted TIM-barrel fold metal-dependent hydrolase